MKKPDWGLKKDEVENKWLESLPTDFEKQNWYLPIFFFSNSTQEGGNILSLHPCCLPFYVNREEGYNIYPRFTKRVLWLIRKLCFFVRVLQSDQSRGNAQN